MMWLMPVLVVMLALVEYGLFLLFNKYGHPWKEILTAALEVDNKPSSQIQCSHWVRFVGPNSDIGPLWSNSTIIVRF